MRGHLANLLLLLSASVVVLALVEILGPLLLPHRGCGGPRIPFWGPDPAAGWTLIPGMRGDAVVCTGAREVARHRIEINAQGQRDRPRSFARTGRRRLLVLGDSFVEAVQVDLADTFAARLERELGVEMLNAGVSGYSTDNELRSFVTRGRRYHPDAVLLVFEVGNDVLENGPQLYLQNPHGMPAKPWLHARARSGAVRACLGAHRALAELTEATPTILWTHSRIVRFGLTDGMQQLLRAACARATGAPAAGGVSALLGVYGEPRTRAWRQAWRTTEALVTHLGARVRSSGARFGVAVAPGCFEYGPQGAWAIASRPGARDDALDLDHPYRRLEALFRRENIPWISLLPALREHLAVSGRPGYYEWDCHWDVEGHAVVAAALRSFVSDLAVRGAGSPPQHAALAHPRSARSP